MGIFEGLWAEFLNLTPLAKISFIVGLGGLPLGSAILAFSRLGRANKIIDGLKAQKSELEKLANSANSALKKAEKDRDLLHPENLVSLIDKELKEGNVKKYVTLIEEGRARFSEWKSFVGYLADYDSSILFGSNLKKNIQQAQLTTLMLSGFDSDRSAGLARELGEIERLSKSENWISLSDDWGVHQSDPNVFGLHATEITRKLNGLLLVNLEIALLERIYWVMNHHQNANPVNKRVSAQLLGTRLADSGMDQRVESTLRNAEVDAPPLDKLKIERVRGTALLQSKQFQEAAKILKSVHRDMHKSLGENHRSTWVALVDLVTAKAYLKEDARSDLLKALAFFRDVDGPHAKTYWGMLESYAEVSEVLGDLKEAQRAYDELIESSSKRSGENDPITYAFKDARDSVGR